MAILMVQTNTNEWEWVFSGVGVCVGGATSCRFHQNHHFLIYLRITSFISICYLYREKVTLFSFSLLLLYSHLCIITIQSVWSASNKWWISHPLQLRFHTEASTWPTLRLSFTQCFVFTRLLNNSGPAHWSWGHEEDQLPRTAASTSAFTNKHTLKHTPWLIWVYPSVEHRDLIPCCNCILKDLIKVKHEHRASPRLLLDNICLFIP